MKLGSAIFLIAVVVAQTGGRPGNAVVAAPGSSGTPLTIETPTKRLSGTAGHYVRLPARITNASATPVRGVVAYASLVEISFGQQATVDLEDWSAHRAVTIGSLAPGQSKDAGWNLRLIKGGSYVIYANAIERRSSWAAVGQEVPLTVRARKNLNPGGVLPVALGVPVLAGAALFGPVFARRRNLAE